MATEKTTKPEFLLSQDNRLAYEPLDNVEHQKYCQQIMDLLELQRRK